MTAPGDLARVLARPALEVAPLLLGARLVHGGVTARITEVEAYAGPDDPGSHAHRGRTPRNASMFGPPGRMYTYFTYGMHWCANVVTGPEGEPGAVLLRAAEVVGGLETARERRPGRRDRDLARGPACLCRTLAMGRDQDGLDLSGLLLLAGPAAGATADPGDGQPVGAMSAAAVRTGPRVGLRLAADLPWRFWLDGEPSVSTYRAAAAARPRRG